MSKQFYTNYYINQSGRGLSTYAGHSRMVGHGFGEIMSSVWKHISPVLFPALKSLKHEAINSGIGILNDLSQNKPIKNTLKSHLKTAGRNVIIGSLKRLQSGGSNIKAAPKKKKRQSKTRCGKDIFS